MSEEQKGLADSADEGFTPSGFEDTVERIRGAMADQADGIVPSPDAYGRVATRVVNESNRPRRLPVWMPPARLLVAGVAGLAVLAGGFAVLGGADRSEPTVVSADAAAVGQDPTVSDSDGQGSAGTARGSDGDADTASDDGSPGSDAASDLAAAAATGVQRAAAGPVGASRQEAGEAFLDLVGAEPAEVFDIDTNSDAVGDMLLVMTVQEGGSEFVNPVAELEVVELADGSGWSVVGATGMGLVSIEQPVANQMINSSPFAIAGTGVGFEGTLDIDVLSAVDGSVLLQAGARGGSVGTSAPYSYEAEVLGTHPAWVVVRSSTGAEGVARPFAAVPVVIDAAPDPTMFVVATVSLDDVDGGLNMRSGPGVDSGKLGVVGWGQAVKRTPGVAAERRGDDIWWPVTDEVGTEGWVNARFLAPAGPLDGGELNAGGQQFLLSAASPDLIGSWFPISPRLGFTVVAKGQMVRLAPTDLQQASGWTEPLIDGRSLSDLVSAPLAIQNELVLRPNGQEFTDPAMEDVALRYFAGLPSVTATYLGSDGQTHTTHVFFENGPTRQHYIGVIIEVSKG